MKNSNVRESVPLSLVSDSHSGTEQVTAPWLEFCFGPEDTQHESIVGSKFGCASSSPAQVCFDVHERFKHLVAETVQSRLLLASLYAGTDSGLPDPRLGATYLKGVVIACGVSFCLT